MRGLLDIWASRNTVHLVAVPGIGGAGNPALGSPLGTAFSRLDALESAGAPSGPA